jgi:hypothetical protein
MLSLIDSIVHLSVLRNRFHGNVLVPSKKQGHNTDIEAGRIWSLKTLTLVSSKSISPAMQRRCTVLSQRVDLLLISLKPFRYERSKTLELRLLTLADQTTLKTSGIWWSVDQDNMEKCNTHMHTNTLNVEVLWLGFMSATFGSDAACVHAEALLDEKEQIVIDESTAATAIVPSEHVALLHAYQKHCIWFMIGTIWLHR